VDANAGDDCHQKNEVVRHHLLQNSFFTKNLVSKYQKEFALFLRTFIFVISLQ
jgi:hypothetical protein